MKAPSGSLRRSWVNELTYKSIVAGGFVWFSATVLSIEGTLRTFAQGKIDLPRENLPEY